MMCIAYVEPVSQYVCFCTVKLIGAAEAENCDLSFKLCCLRKAEVLSEYLTTRERIHGQIENTHDYPI